MNIKVPRKRLEFAHPSSDNQLVGLVVSLLPTCLLVLLCGVALNRNLDWLMVIKDLVRIEVVNMSLNIKHLP